MTQELLRDDVIRSLLERIERLETREDATEWRALSYTVGWEDYGSTWENGEYRRVGDRVEVRGLCKRTSGSSLTIATLPTGFRPQAFRMCVGVQRDTVPTPIRIDISTDGSINMKDATADFGYVSLELSFDLI